MVPMPKNLNEFSKVEILNFLSSFDSVLTDCDGVLWLENEVIENSEKTINKFIENKKRVFYVTNNNSKTREEYAKKCDNLGFRATKDNIISTAYLAADYLKNLDFNKKVYIIGNEGIVKELNKVGIRHLDIGPDVMDTDMEAYIGSKLNLDPEVGAVLVGFDQHISYPKLMKAAIYLRDPNVHFIAACTDESFRVSSNLVLPGTGCTVRYLEAATGRKAVVMGKPNDCMKNFILKQNFDPPRTLFIGDRCNTDILFGKRCGFQTLLVLTGVTSLTDVEKYANSPEPGENGLVPQYYIDKLGDLLPYL